MGVFARLDSWLESLGRQSEDAPIQVIQYGSTKSYTFRRAVTKDNFTLSLSPDQGDNVAVLRAVQAFYMPDLTDEDFNNLRQMLILTDDVILGGLKDPSNWVLPRGFSDIPFVKARLERNFPIEHIIGLILSAARLYVWLYKMDEDVSNLIPHLLELEETYSSLVTQVESGKGSRGSDDALTTVDARTGYPKP